jgi:hypothetical protein
LNDPREFRTVMDCGEELTRVVDILRSMPLAKLARAMDAEPRLGAVADVVEPSVTRAQLARDLAQWLADATAQAEGLPHRKVPDVGDSAVGDQIAVTGADLLRAAPDDPVLLTAAARLRALRLML